MKNKKMLLIITIIILTIIAILAILKIINKDSAELKFKLDTSDKYLVTTNKKAMSYMTDGGTHYNEYYEINFQTSTVRKCEDYYEASKGYIYREKKIYDKVLSAQENMELKKLLDRILNDGGSKDHSTNILATLNSYTISTEKHSNIEMGDSVDIEKFNKLVSR